jgi:hypothetical protein
MQPLWDNSLIIKELRLKRHEKRRTQVSYYNNKPPRVACNTANTLNLD